MTKPLQSPFALLNLAFNGQLAQADEHYGMATLLCMHSVILQWHLSFSDLKVSVAGVG